MKTLTSRQICERLSDRISGFVSTALAAAPNDFKVLYKNRANDFQGGFRRIDAVPKALLAKAIARDCAVDPLVGLAVLKNWFHAKRALYETAVGLLKSLDYQIVEPDFEKDIIAHQSLASKHIQLEDEAYYFAPGESATELDKLELTVMVALLGWFPELEE